MVEHVNKTLSLPREMADELGQADNQSAVVREALQAYWGEGGESDE
jgi:hypothetical protein